MNNELKTKSELLYTQAKQQFDLIKGSYESGDLTTEVEVLHAAFQAFQEFFSIMGHQRFEALTFDESTPLWSEDYNGIMDDIYLDFETLFREATLLADAMYVDFNHHVVQQDILTEKLKTVQNKLYDLAAYNSIEGYHKNVFVKEEFLNQDRIDYDKVTMNPLRIEGGNVTMPQISNRSVLTDATATIVIGSREDTASPVGASSNGFPGNNHEVVTSTKEIERTGKSLNLVFLGATNNHANYGAILDGNPNTWFEYEKIIPSRLVASASGKDYGFAYKTANDKNFYWSESLEEGVLRLCLQVHLKGVQLINGINIELYVPSNRLAQAARVARVLVITEENESVNVAYENIGTYFKFSPIKARSIQFFFEQEHSYTTEIGHIFYTKKYIAEDRNGQKHSVINRIAEANNRVDGPMPSITDIGATIEDNLTNKEVKYAPRKANSEDLSVNEVLSNLNAQNGNEDIEMGVERIQAERYCIGIKDIQIFEATYEQEGELITKPFYFEEPLERIALDITESDSFNADWLEYAISVDDGITWHPIIPLHRQVQGTKTYIIQQVEKTKGIVTREGVIETHAPVYSIRIRIIGRKGELEQLSEVKVNPAATPVLRTMEIQGQVRTTDKELTFVASEEQTFNVIESKPIPPVPPIDKEKDPSKPPAIPDPDDCLICKEPGNSGQEPDNPLETEGETETDVENIIKSLLKSSKYKICLDEVAGHLKKAIIQYGAVSTPGSPITHFYVEFEQFPEYNETLIFSETDYMQLISKERILDLSTMSPGDEVNVYIYAKNVNGYQLHDNISISIARDCKLTPEPVEGDERSFIDIDMRQAIGRVCEHNFISASDVKFVGVILSKQPIVRYEVYENNSIVASQVFKASDRIHSRVVTHTINKDLYRADQKIISPYIVAYDVNGDKYKRTFRLSLKQCVEKNQSYLYASFLRVKKEYCVDEDLQIDWTVGSIDRLQQIRIWYGTKQVYNKIYALSDKITRQNGILKMPYNELSIGKKMLRIELVDITGQVTSQEIEIELVNDCLRNDPRRNNHISLIVSANSKYCICGEPVQFFGEIKVNPQLSHVNFKIGGTQFEPSNLNPFGLLNEEDCGVTLGNSSVQKMSAPEGLSSIEKLEWMAENGQLQPTTNEAEILLMEELEEYEIDENCGCKRKKGTKQARERAMRMMNTDTAPPISMIPDISPVIKKVDDELYTFHFELPFWFLFNSGFHESGKKYYVTIEAFTTTGEKDIKLIPLTGEECLGKTPPPPPVDEDDPTGEHQPEEEVIEEPEDPNSKDETCNLDIIQTAVVTYYDVARRTFSTQRLPMTKGGRRTVKDSIGNRFIVDAHAEKGEFYIQQMSMGTYPGVMIAQLYLEVGPKDHSIKRRYDVTSSAAFKKAENEGLLPLMASKSQTEITQHYTFDQLIRLGDASDTSRLLERDAAFILRFDGLDWNALCPHTHLNYDLNDEAMKAEKDEVPPELECKDHKLIHLQYFDDVAMKLRDLYISLVEGHGDVYRVQARNGATTELGILAGYSGLSKGPALSIAFGDAEEEDAQSFIVTAVGIGYEHQAGGVSFSYAERTYYTTRENPAISFLYGPPKTMSDLTWVRNGIVHANEAPWIGGVSDMISFSIKMPSDTCNPEDEVFDPKLPIPWNQIKEREQLEKKGVILFRSYVLPVYNRNIAPGEIEAVRGVFQIRRVYQGFNKLHFIFRYHFENGVRTVRYHPAAHIRTGELDTTHTSTVLAVREVSFDFVNMDHLGYGKVTKVEVFPELEHYEDGKPVRIEYQNAAFEIPVEDGNRNESMEFYMNSSTATTFLDSVCIDRIVPETYTFKVDYRLFENLDIQQFGIQIRSAREVIGEYYQTYNNVRAVNGNIPVLIDPKNLKAKSEPYYYAVPMVQFKGSNALVPISKYQLRLRTITCVQSV